MSYIYHVKHAWRAGAKGAQMSVLQETASSTSSSSTSSTAKYTGPPVRIVRGEYWPGRIPFDFLCDIKGEEEARALLDDMDPDEYSEKFLRGARAGFVEKGLEDEWDEFLMNQGKQGGLSLEWAIMDLPPHRTFNLHAHPTLEVVHIIKGSLYERRMQGSPLSLGHAEKVTDLKSPDLSTLHPPPSFTDAIFPEGSINVNERGSIHQSWTEEEGCFLLCIWGGQHLNIPQDRFSKGFVCGGGCHVKEIHV